MDDAALYALFPEARHFTAVKYKLFLSAIELFAKQGYSNTATHQIARKAQVSEASLFKCFTNKQGILTMILKPVAHHILPDVIKEFSQKVLQKKTADLNELITLMVHNRLDFCQQHQELTQIYLNEMITDAVWRQKLVQYYPQTLMQDFDTEINYLRARQKIVNWNNTEIFRFILTNIFGYFLEHYVLFPQKSWQPQVGVCHLITFITNGLSAN
ncbi:TetR/AcrR family transcriptional regulator [Bombilactobacillus thymidiniphilus]|uniref:TetR/AcrR family transcriptional regulator n=1 Tax=Bombilactobacillus thymidiniphilus TaxID=2923363 RepID=A0ABY4PC29_9LACO|nr:TetR/AcrR family transcriptional regulator [Bombilactobacillus thymidiniphilus]UQS83109.1 TetR/AcrR family transcriptional regulator [Bombilactobacillus thymidiniphilus]